MLKRIVVCGISILPLTGASVSAAENCATYSVVPGDTLRLISERYYGARDLSSIIYSANLELVGENPNTIEIGMELAIPCREDMQSPQPTAFLALVGPETETALKHPFSFVTRAGETPFVRQDNSGVLPDILAAALSKGGFDGEMALLRPEDTSEVLQASSRPEALLSFPWVLPNCESPATLSPQSTYLCGNYTFSSPLYEITLGIFTQPDTPLLTAETAAAFGGKNICTSQFYSDDLLRENGLAATANVVVSSALEKCIAGLNAGTFDAIIADYQSYRQIGLRDSGIVDIPYFAKTSTLHAIAYTQNMAAMDVLSITNVGLKQILTSGEWFGIVNQHLAQLSH